MTGKEAKTEFIIVRKTKADKAEIVAAAERHGYKNLTHFVDDAIRYFIKEADRSRG